MSTLLELLDQLVELNIDGAMCDDPDKQVVLADNAEEVFDEIKRRLERVMKTFHEPESTRIQAILETGKDEPWWQS